MSAVRWGSESPLAMRVVLAWIQFYTRDVPAELAGVRRAELESDVWEQVNDPDIRRGRRALYLLWRTARSVPADLIWRVGVLRQADSAPRSMFARWEQGGLNALLLAQAFIVSSLIAAVILHVLQGGNAGSLSAGQAPTLAALGVGMALGVIGFALLLRHATRWLGSLLIAVASVALVAVGGPAIVRISTTAAAVYYSTPFMGGSPSWHDLLLISVVMLSLFHVSVALAWVPSVRRATGQRAAQ